MNKRNNEPLESIEDKVVAWHTQRNLINGATDWSQTTKLLEEFTELVAAQMSGASALAVTQRIKQMLYGLHSAGRVKPVMSHAQEAKLDAVGDMTVVLMNIAKRNDTSVVACTEIAYDEIKDRKGRMISGNFVKEGDLPNDILT